MIIPTPWRDVPDNARVIDPKGNVFHVLPRTLPGMRQVRSASGDTFPIATPEDDLIPMVWEPQDVAVQTLSRVFKLEYLKEAGR